LTQTVDQLARRIEAFGQCGQRARLLTMSRGPSSIRLCILTSALERERLCSGDPVCADHDPTTAYEDRALHGAACHGCLLVAETSCEARNLFLDRALIVETVRQTGAGFF
jgi:hypothetical protein